jgi:cytochrome c oxidase subunit II
MPEFGIEPVSGLGDIFYWIHRTFFDHMPEQASTFAPGVDFINNFITYVSVFCTVTITGAMVYFGLKYRRKSDDQATAYVTHNTTLEIVWTAIPTVVCIFVFYYGFAVYRDMRNPPANPLEINVSGRRWAWDFQYPGGKRSTGELVVPVDQPVRLVMRSQDVNHSFFIPAMRAKEDVIANTYHFLWFHPTKAGKYPIFCTEYCGDDHSHMLAELRVVSRAEYEDYVASRTKGDAPQLPPEELGKQIYNGKGGCVACHSLDGSAKVGPTFKGLFGKAEELSDGTKVTADENYLRVAIKNPQAQIVKGFEGLNMPAVPLDDSEVDAIISFIKTVK